VYVVHTPALALHASDSDCSTTHAAAWPDRAPIMAMIPPSLAGGWPAGSCCIYMDPSIFAIGRQADAAVQFYTVLRSPSVFCCPCMCIQIQCSATIFEMCIYVHIYMHVIYIVYEVANICLVCCNGTSNFLHDAHVIGKSTSFFCHI